MSTMFFQIANCEPGFFYQVVDPTQPLGLPVINNLYNYHVPAPSLYYNPALLHASVPYTLKGCTNNIGVAVPCNIGGIPTVIPAVEENSPKETIAIEDAVNFEDQMESDIVQVAPIEQGAVIEARRKRDADPYYFGYGLRGYHGYSPYAYMYNYGYGCQNHLGQLVPCA